MKRVKKTAAIGIIMSFVCLISVFVVSAQYGSSAVVENQTYTLKQMLTYAIEDEYLANARYTIDIDKFGSMRPFTRILEAENRHISLLKPLFIKNSLPIPDDVAAQYIAAPDSLLAAMKAGVTGEKNNIRMYEIFLKQQLPDDVRVTFTLLRDAAQNHLRTFERITARLESMLPGTSG